MAGYIWIFTDHNLTRNSATSVVGSGRLCLPRHTLAYGTASLLQCRLLFLLIAIWFTGCSIRAISTLSASTIGVEKKANFERSPSVAAGLPIPASNHQKINNIFHFLNLRQASWVRFVFPKLFDHHHLRRRWLKCRHWWSESSGVLFTSSHFCRSGCSSPRCFQQSLRQGCWFINARAIRYYMLPPAYHVSYHYSTDKLAALG